jgi:hypothetical protein
MFLSMALVFSVGATAVAQDFGSGTQYQSRVAPENGQKAALSCGNAGYDNDVRQASAFWNGGQAGDPDKMFAVRFVLADFGYQPGDVEITGFCASNVEDLSGFGGPWPNEVFIYPDLGGVPDDSTVLGQGTIITGDGTGPSTVTLSSPVTLNGDFWLVNRGDPQHDGEDFNMEYDTGANVGNSYSSSTGIMGLAPVPEGNFMLRASLQEKDNGGGNGTGDGAYNYFLAAIAHTPGVGDALWRSKVGVLNRSGSSAEVTFTYFWKNGPTTVKSFPVKRTVGDGVLETWDDAAVSLFGVTNNSSGSVLINSTQPVVVTARTYNVGEDGSFGSFMPGVSAFEAVRSDEIGFLSQLTGNDDFRTNVGLVNLTDQACQVRVRVYDVDGVVAGSAVTKNLNAYQFKQINDVFGAADAGDQDDAYATVEVLTAGCEAWAYGAIIDGTSAFPGTDDATTIPLTVFIEVKR